MNTRPKRNDPAPGNGRTDYFWPFMICLTLLMGTVVYHLSTLRREKAPMATNSHPVAVPEPDAASGAEKPRPYPPALARRVAAPVTSNTDIVVVPANTAGPTRDGETGDRVVVVRPAMPAFGNYTQTLPGSTIAIEMVAIPGGEMVLGSPVDEPGREASDQPQRHRAFGGSRPPTSRVSAWRAMRPAPAPPSMPPPPSRHLPRIQLWPPSPKANASSRQIGDRFARLPRRAIC